MRKIKLLVCLCAVLLAGCTKKQQEPENTAVIEDRISITETDFTQTQAIAIFQKVLNDHCGTGVCTVNTVTIDGADIIGVYTYQENEKTMKAEGVLKNVSVNPSDSTIVYFQETVFNDTKTTESNTNTEPSHAQQETKSDTNEGSTVAGIPHVDIDKSYLDVDNDENLNDRVLYEEGRKSIVLFYSTGGTRTYEGTLHGDGLMRIVILDANQKVVKEVIHATKEGDFSGSVDLQKGFYLQYIESEGAGSEFYWSTSME